eukprot:CAMPEP_0202730242 /NCGR_PEP_ID=MMETSP1385-20130828/186540_1 /ASSEMBLY_ACC=CAM_ASM_000861 /TAXON_ID=933848 /ORGANISM="Elphidium margaritaceum" /LENGTH=555 /DNA_ID=CAMNT_0049396515 /DNA_START=393 /DNA_END=2059 /DNA_ORIENTATION=+
MFLSYFNWRRATHLCAYEWSKQLNLMDNVALDQTGDLDLSKMPWTMRYGHILTNPKVLLAAVCVLWLLYFGPSTVLVNTVTHVSQPLHDWFAMSYGVPLIAPVMLLGCVSSKLFYDTLGIKTQLIRVAAVLYASLFGICINIAVVPLGKWRILVTYCAVFETVVVVGILMVRIPALNAYIRAQSKDVAGVNSRASSLETAYDVNESRTQFEAVWNDKELFQLFATHLVTEYSVETLLFLMEYAQCRQLVLNNIPYIVRTRKMQQEFLSVIAHHREQQDVQWNISNSILCVRTLKQPLSIHHYTNFVCYLYNKYIHEEGVAMVNISAQVRDRIDTAYNKYNLIQEHRYSMKALSTDFDQSLNLDALGSSSVKSIVEVLHTRQRESDDNAGAVESPDTNVDDGSTTHCSDATEHMLIEMLADVINCLEEASVELYWLLMQDSFPAILSTDFDQSLNLDALGSSSVKSIVEVLHTRQRESDDNAGAVESPDTNVDDGSTTHSSDVTDHMLSEMLADVINCLEEASVELYWLLMQDSFPRFRQTEPFQQFMQLKSSVIA